MSGADAILVFGRTGQVAAALARLCDERGRTGHFLARSQADFCDPAALIRAVAETPARVVVNAAAYTAVDRAEEDAESAHAVNAVAPGAIAEACRARRLPMIHLSTNFVFDGAAPAPYREDDAPHPRSVYGATKLAGEAAVRAAAGAHAILRTGWVFGPGGKNFPASVIAAARGRQVLSMVADEIGDPTPAKSIAETILLLADRLAGDAAAISGLYHYSGAPSASRLDFAAAVLAAAERAGAAAPPRLEPIASSDYAARAIRPLNGRLDCGKIERALRLSRPDWRLALGETVQHILARGAGEPR